MRLLTADIVAGVRPTGAMLPKETDLAAEFRVSRGVARETIRAMEERGLISVTHGRGAIVNGSEHWDLFDPDVLAATLDTERSGDVLAQYLECRRVLEVEAAGLAAERATKQDLERLALALARMEESTTRPPSHAAEELFHEADIAFHQALIGATGNQALGGLVKRLHSALLLARYPLARPQYRQERALPEHRRILAEVSSGHTDAARQAMNDHLDTVARYLGEHRGTVRRKRRRPAAGVT